MQHEWWRAAALEQDWQRPSLCFLVLRQLMKRPNWSAQLSLLEWRKQAWKSAHTASKKEAQAAAFGPLWLHWCEGKGSEDTFLMLNGKWMQRHAGMLSAGVEGEGEKHPDLSCQLPSSWGVILGKELWNKQCRLSGLSWAICLLLLVTQTWICLAFWRVMHRPHSNTAQLQNSDLCPVGIHLISESDQILETLPLV